MATQYQFHHHYFPRTIKIEETGDILNLRGVALHKQYFTDKYLAAFYSHDPLNNPQQALQDKNAKRLMIYFLYPFHDFRHVIQNGLMDNNSPIWMDRDQINISQFIKMIDVSLKAGDVVTFDYLPKVGTKVMINGSVRGIIKGNEFYTSILKIWMGRQPPSKKFREDLFNLLS